MTAACAPVGSPVVAPAGAKLVALVGNPNVGKSSLFNALTGLRQRVANYAGVTVDALEGPLTLGGKTARLLDLPGTYGLVPSAADEAVVERVLRDAEAPPDVILVVLEAAQLRRGLALVSEVMDLGRPMVVALNMVDEARRAGLTVPTAKLAERLGCPVIETVATTGEGIPKLLAALEAPATPVRGWKFADAALEARLDNARPSPSPGETLKDTPWERLRTLREADPALRPAEVAARFGWVADVLGAAPSASTVRARTDAIDRWLLHPAGGPVFFLVVMGLVFQSVFAWAEPLMKLIEEGVGLVKGWAEAGLVAHPLLSSLVTSGVIDGVGAVVVFLPQILILFFFLSLLEDTGYMARAAFLVDRPLKALGLSGRSFIPLMSSFACAIPGVLATRTIPSRRERLLAMFLAPLMTCSARLPVYTLLIAAFIPETPLVGPIGLQGLVLFALYLSGMAAAAGLAFVVSRSKRTRGKELPLVVELPPYRRPGVRSVLLKLKLRGGDFLKRAGTTIFVVSVVLWALSTFPRVEPPAGLTPEEGQAYAREQSLAGRMGKTIEPVIAPLGYDWKLGVGIIASFAAREVLVGTMGVVYSVGEGADEENETLRDRIKAETFPPGHPSAGQKVYTLPTVLSLLVFYVFALQCGATVAVVKRESASWGFALGQLALFGALAWVGAFVVRHAALALGL